MGWFEITCDTTIPLAAYGEPDDFVVAYAGKVVRLDDGDQESEAGRFTLYRVQVGRCWSSRVRSESGW
jgi:hypothetical protein